MPSSEPALFSERIETLKPSPIRDILSVVEASRNDLLRRRPAGQRNAFHTGREAFREMSSSTGRRRAIRTFAPRSPGGLRGFGSRRAAGAGDDTLRAPAGHRPRGEALRRSGNAGRWWSRRPISRRCRFSASSARGSSSFEPGTPQKARLAYVMPTFANPTGHCASEAEARSACSRVPRYRDGAVRGRPLSRPRLRPLRPPADSRDMHGGSWIYQGSFSKTFAPGLRLGFLAASEDLFDRLVMLKQATDLHSSRLSQRIVLEAIADSAWPARLKRAGDLLSRSARHLRALLGPALRRHRPLEHPQRRPVLLAAAAGSDRHSTAARISTQTRGRLHARRGVLPQRAPARNDQAQLQPLRRGRRRTRPGDPRRLTA